MAFTEQVGPWVCEPPQNYNTESASNDSEHSLGHENSKLKQTCVHSCAIVFILISFALIFVLGVLAVFLITSRKTGNSNRK